MVVAVSVCELHLPGARSLKQKRKVVRSLIERMHSRYRLSVAETDYHDLHQRAEIGIAAITLSMSEAQKLMDRLRELIDSEPELYLTHWEPQLMEGVS